MKRNAHVFYLLTAALTLACLICALPVYSGSTSVTSDGIKFPDGTIQTTAAGSGSTPWITSGSNIYYNSGNVGIGTASPSAKLYVSGNIALTEANFIRWDEAGGGMRFAITSNPAADDLTFLNRDSTELMRIKTNGSVGIGTTTPAAKLSLKDNSDAPGIVLEGAGFMDEGEVWGPIDLIQNNEIKGRLYWKGHDDGHPDFIVQLSESQGSTKALTVLGNNGNVGIGTTDPSYKLHVNGDAAGTSWTNLSSRQFKQDIRRVDEASHPTMLAKLMDVDITTYKYKEECGGNGATKLGFIAEEMPNEVLSEDGKGVDLYELLTMTIGAMKAQQKQIASQQKENEILKRELAAIMVRLRALEK